MATAPSSLPSRRNSAGCMGSFPHLLDFNQALAGKKRLTDKRYVAGREASKGGADVADGAAGTPDSSTGRNSGLLFNSKESSPKEMPVAPLRIPNNSKKGELTKQSPSVVARLMGLDMMPPELKVIDRPRKWSTQENSVTNVLLERQSSQRNTAGKTPDNLLHDSKPSKASPTRNMSNNQGVHRSSNRCLPDTLLEKHSQIVQEAFGAWIEKEDQPLTTEGVDTQDPELEGKEMLNCQKDYNARPGVLQESLSNNNQNATQEKLQESKEVLDAVSFLQSNKEFFIRFLQEPDSLFKRQRQSNQTDAAGKFTDTAIHGQTYYDWRGYGPEGEGFKGQSCNEESRELRRSGRTKQQHAKIHTENERKLVTGKLVPSFASEVQHDCMLSFSSSKQSKLSHVNCSIPTRIVVLKPSPTRSQHFKVFTVDGNRSPKDCLQAVGSVKGNNENVLNEIKEKLYREIRETFDLRRKTDPSEVYRSTKDPREIAQEIAKHVREKSLRDLVTDPGVSNDYLMAKNRASLGRRCREMVNDTEAAKETSLSMGVSPVEEQYFLHSLNQKREINPQRGHRNKDESKMLKAGKFNAISSELQKFLLDKRGDSCHYPPGSSPLPCTNTSGRHSVDGMNVCQGKDLSHLSEEKAQCGVPKDLTRSRSIPFASKIVEKSEKEPCRKDIGQLKTDRVLTGKDKAEMTSALDLSSSNGSAPYPHDGKKRSIFSRKVSSWKGSLFVGRKSKEHFDKVSSAQSQLDTEVDTQKTKCLSNEIMSIRSSSDCESCTSLLEAEVPGTKDMVNAELPACQQSGEKLPVSHFSSGGCAQIGTEPNGDLIESSQKLICSPLSSPERSISATNKDLNGNNSNLNKEQLEQPSPVSVLDAPFQEEEANPVNFEEISSGLKELRMRLDLLKFLDDEPVPKPKATNGEEGELMQKDTVEGKGGQPVDNIQSRLDSQGAHMNLSSRVSGTKCPPNDAENCGLSSDQVVCPVGKEKELYFVKNLLRASGFLGDTVSILTRWYAPTQPLDPCVFANMQVGSYGMECDIQEKNIGTCEQGEGVLDLDSRHLLFDRVNEVLLQVLGPLVKNKTICWCVSTRMPAGKELLKAVWERVCGLSCSQSGPQDSLGNLVAKDLAKGDQWLDLGSDMEAVGLELESLILKELLDETLLVLKVSDVRLL